MTLGRLARLQSRCQKGSKRWRRLQYAKERASGKNKRRVRDLRHKGTRLAVDFCQQAAQSFIWKVPLRAPQPFNDMAG